MLSKTVVVNLKLFVVCGILKYYFNVIYVKTVKCGIKFKILQFTIFSPDSIVRMKWTRNHR